MKLSSSYLREPDEIIRIDTYPEAKANLDEEDSESSRESTEEAHIVIDQMVKEK